MTVLGSGHSIRLLTRQRKHVMTIREEITNLLLRSSTLYETWARRYRTCSCNKDRVALFKEWKDQCRPLDDRIQELQRQCKHLRGRLEFDLFICDDCGKVLCMAIQQKLEVLISRRRKVTENYRKELATLDDLIDRYQSSCVHEFVLHTEQYSAYKQCKICGKVKGERWY